MTDLTKNGTTETKEYGQEQYEWFSRKVGGKSKKYCSYDYRHIDGELFSCVKPALEECRVLRDEWLQKRHKQ
jgi:hypothetical protein